MNENKLNAKATAGIYAEVMRQIYDTVEKRFREAVSNGYDAKATKISISVYLGADDQIIIRDNGFGMDEEDLKTKYINMGGGGKYEDEDAIGRIGIGALSIFALGDKITVKTRKKDTDKVLTAELDFSQLKDAEKHALPLDQVSVGRIKSNRDANEHDEDHFTEVTIRSLSDASKEIFNNDDKTKSLIDKLERILPVPLRLDDALFDRLPPQIIDLLKNDKYRIEVEFHCPGQDYEHYPIMRKSIMSVDNAKISRFYPIHPYTLAGGYDSQLQVYGYMYINADKALPKEWQGINVRVKNVTIESNTFFFYEKDSAARVRIGGELFIKNIDENSAIQSNRSGFAAENPDYLLISEYMRGRIAEVVKIVRQNSSIDTIVKKVIKKIENISKKFQKNASIEDAKIDADKFKSLDDPNVLIENGIRPFDLEKRLEDELEDSGIEFDFIWSGVIKDLYYVDYSDDDYYTIQVHNDLKKFVYDVDGNSVEYILGFCGEDIPLIVKKPGKVLINLENNLVQNNDILNLEPGFLEVVLAIYLNYLKCENDAEKLYYNSIRDLA